ncbi:LPIN3 phosphatase, partial [Amia calva]|nr:LPIN3 phosphatase [Amia calva]
MLHGSLFLFLFLFSLQSQTMNYVGQLAETVFVTVKELYRGLNPATLTGGIDVIVVRQPDGSLQCSPFHVRFGKLGVLRSREKVVDIEINGEPVELHMKLGDNGEAFFVEENEDFQERVPAHLCTSPITLEGNEDSESPLNSTSRRKKRRRKRTRSDAPWREKEDSSADDASVYYSFSEEPMENLGSAQSRGVHPYSDGEWSPSESVFQSRPSSPKSDSELLVKPQESTGPQMHWAWGSFPKVRPSDRVSAEAPSVSTSIQHSTNTHFRTIQRQDSFDLHTEGLEGSTVIGRGVTVLRPEPRGRPPGPPTPDTVPPTAEPESFKRSQHLGPTDIYLDDLTNLDPEVAALYFPKSDNDMGPQPGAEPGLQFDNQSPQSVGSGAMDSGTEYLSDSTGDLPEVTMSLCGKVVDTSHINKEKFMEHVVSFQDFVNNPGIIEDPNLVICINSKYYNWAVAAPMVLSMQAFQKNLPKSAVDQLVKDKMPKKSGRWWFSWRRKDLNTNQEHLDGTWMMHYSIKISFRRHSSRVNRSDASREVCWDKREETSSDDDSRTARGTRPLEPLSTAQCISQMYRKSLRLTSEQIERLNLREGANEIVFSVTTQYQGTCRCEAAIYLWNWDDRVIISDIDGTITKSDALGHILPQLGKDWTHRGIAKLYHKIHQNGYKFLYCSARAIGMADITKGYLQWVNDRGTVLPKGPVLLAPSSLFSALHREVIEKKPEVFKIACLTDIRNLFNPKRHPFYAAFGNRTNDVYAYKEVGVPESRIFTVNPKGELIQEQTKGNKSSYSRLSELVEHLFPLLVQGKSSSFDCPDYSHFSFWREPLPALDLSVLQ